MSDAKKTPELPPVLVVHENRGLNPHIEDIARRIALDNFIAFAPDALFPLGGYPGTQHGFNNDTTPRFDKDAAALAWQRTISFFNEQLRT